jgi:polysaccharide biosynthesis/export protein
MNSKRCFFSIVTAVLLYFVSTSVGHCQTDMRELPGDRLASTLSVVEGSNGVSVERDSYKLRSGDVLSINVRGRSAISYAAKPGAGAGEDPNEVMVSPTGDISLPLIGSIQAAGKTVDEVEASVRTSLAEYLKHFEVNISIVKVGTPTVWVSGSVINAGPQTVPAVATVGYAVLRAGLMPTGSTRRIELVRGGSKQIIDLYRIAVLGDTASDVVLQPGDRIFVPAITDYVGASGEVVRGGRFEMAGRPDEDFRVRDLIDLALGTSPTAALDRASIERIGPDGKVAAIPIDLRSPKSADTALQPGDNLVIPSITAFQSIIRLIGEFKGDGVYQRSIGTTALDVQNKSGIYPLKQGQTVLDVITATGGVTPQADLKRARIERSENGEGRLISVDLERLLIHGDKSVDVTLKNGDSLILPAVMDKIHVFGEVSSPGSYIYSPNRRVVDYIGNAGGPTIRAKLSSVRVVRGTASSPQIFNLNVSSAIKGRSTAGNPVLEPGDIVYVPSKLFGDWREGLQLIFSAVSLQSLLTK